MSDLSSSAGTSGTLKANGEMLHREHCWTCRKAKVCCYCADIVPFATSPRFLILIHPLEARHSVGTGRMAHQILSNSLFWEGQKFRESEKLKNLLADPKIFPVLLFPGEGSLQLSNLSMEERRSAFPLDRELLVIVLDATWNLAKKMLRQSPLLQTLPRICFTPNTPSEFVIRKQPKSYCYSTIEAIHQVLNLMNEPMNEQMKEGMNRDVQPDPFEGLISVFKKMVKQQLDYQNARPEGRSRHARNFLIRQQKLHERQARQALVQSPEPKNDSAPKSCLSASFLAPKES